MVELLVTFVSTVSVGLGSGVELGSTAAVVSVGEIEAAEVAVGIADGVSVALRVGEGAATVGVSASGVQASRSNVASATPLTVEPALRNMRRFIRLSCGGDSLDRPEQGTLSQLASFWQTEGNSGGFLSPSTCSQGIEIINRTANTVVPRRVAPVSFGSSDFGS
jgi:hypothetical protein